MAEPQAFELPFKREPTRLLHHYTLGQQWLIQSAGGVNTVPLMYAGFEFRLFIERLIFHYWYGVAGMSKPLLGREKEFGSVKAMRQAIRRIAGKQEEIDRAFLFFDLLSSALKLPLKVAAPNIKTLEKHWGVCSEFCHYMHNVSCEPPECHTAMFDQLTEVKQHLDSLLTGPPAWPNFPTSMIDDVRRRFIAGEASELDVQAFVREFGLYAGLDPGGGAPPRILSSLESSDQSEADDSSTAFPDAQT